MALSQQTRTEAERSDARTLDVLDHVVRYAYARLGSLEEAEDVAVEVWQQASQRRGGMSELENPRVYLLGMARRKVVDHVRSRIRQRGKDTVLISDLPEMPHSPTDPTQAVAVREVLRQLPESYQEVLILKYLHGLSAEEIASVIGKSRVAARSLLQRARDAFATNGAHLVEDGHVGGTAHE